MRDGDRPGTGVPARDGTREGGVDGTRERGERGVVDMNAYSDLSHSREPV